MNASNALILGTTLVPITTLEQGPYFISFSYHAENNIQIENASRADSNIAAAIALVEKEEGDGDGYGNVYGGFDVLNNFFRGGEL